MSQSLSQGLTSDIELTLQEKKDYYYWKIRESYNNIMAADNLNTIQYYMLCLKYEIKSLLEDANGTEDFKEFIDLKKDYGWLNNDFELPKVYAENRAQFDFLNEFECLKQKQINAYKAYDCSMRTNCLNNFRFLLQRGNNVTPSREMRITMMHFCFYYESSIFLTNLYRDVWGDSGSF